MGFWNKRINIKNRKDIAKDINVEEEKLKELEQGKREIGGKTMDKVLESIEENRIKSAIRKADILRWYETTNLKKLRKSFGYATQKDLAKILGYDNSVICNLETKRTHKLTPAEEVLQRDNKINNLNLIIEMYKEEVSKLKKQIARYEKLIDKM